MSDNYDSVITVRDIAFGGKPNPGDYARSVGRSVLVIDSVRQTEKWIVN